MDFHAIEYYSAYSESGAHGNFHQVICLHDDPLLEWGEVNKIVPGMCRGWYELAQLSSKDRIEFTRDYWLDRLPYHPSLNEGITKFFASLDDLGVFITQQSYEDPYTAHLVYSLAGNSGFFHGESHAGDEEIIRLQKEFSDFILPPDYISFLKIHNGFAKITDTGLIPARKVKETYEVFQQMVGEDEEPITADCGKVQVNPASLIPFYESFGQPCFQCFWKDWYPDEEMGNVYFSSETKKISICDKKEDCPETLAFQAFTDWLMFYLEKID